MPYAISRRIECMESEINFNRMAIHAMKCYESLRQFQTFKFIAIGLKHGKPFNCGNRTVVVFAVIDHDLDQPCMKTVLTSIARVVRDSWWLYRNYMIHTVSAYNTTELKYMLAMVIDQPRPHHMRLKYEPISFLDVENSEERVVHPERPPEVYGFD